MPSKVFKGRLATGGKPMSKLSLSEWTRTVILRPTKQGKTIGILSCVVIISLLWHPWDVEKRAFVKYTTFFYIGSCVRMLIILVMYWKAGHKK